MKGIYLCARKHRIPGYSIEYNDIECFPGVDIVGDCMNIDLSKYDFIIATPPCNYWSRANYRREDSHYVQRTKDLLPMILRKCLDSGKLFIVENVNNTPLFEKYHLLDDLYGLWYFDFGNHTFWTNVLMLVPDRSFAKKQNKQYVSREKRDGNENVDIILKLFLETIHQRES